MTSNSGSRSSTGFEVQIDEFARGRDGERNEHRTGAIYDISLGPEQGSSDMNGGAELLRARGTSSRSWCGITPTASRLTGRR